MDRCASARFRACHGHVTLDSGRASGPVGRRTRNRIPVSPPGGDSGSDQGNGRELYVLSRPRLAVSILFLVHGLVVSAWVSRIPAIQAEHHLSPARLGTVLLAISAGSMLSMPVAGRLGHAFGSRIVVICSTMMFCGSLPLIALAPDVIWLAAALAYFGASAGAMDVSMNAEGVALERNNGRPIMSSFHALFSIGGMAGSALGGWAASAGFAPLPQLAASAVTFAAISLTVFGWLPRAVVEERAQFSFHFTRRLAAIGLLAFCVLVGEGAMADWTAVYLHTGIGTGPGTAAAGYAVFSAFMAAGRIAGDRLTEVAGRVRLARTGTLVAAIGLASALAIANLPASLIGFACVGAGFAAIVPLVYAAAGRLPNVDHNAAIAAVSVAGYTGFLIGPPLIGITAEYTSLRIALGIVVTLAVIASTLAGSIALPAASAAESGESPQAQ